LRAFTPRDQKAVKAAAETMRPKPGLDIGAAITELGVGEALVSCMDEKGRPCVTEQVFICPPSSQIGPITPEQRQALRSDSIVAGVYENTVDRESAFEALKGRTASRAPAAASASSRQGHALPKATNENSSAQTHDSAGLLDSLGGMLGGGTKHTRAGVGEQLLKSAASAIGREVGRQVIRGVLGSIFGGKR
jgi:hypothetical protein